MFLKKSKCKQFLSSFLVFALVLTLLPSSAFALTTGDTVRISVVNTYVDDSGNYTEKISDDDDEDKLTDTFSNSTRLTENKIDTYVYSSDMSEDEMDGSVPELHCPRTPSPLCCSMRSSPRTGLIALPRWRTRLTRCWADLVVIASTRSSTWIWLTPITAMHGSPPAMASIFTGLIRRGQIGALTSRFSTSRACTGMAKIPGSMWMTLNW